MTGTPIAAVARITQTSVPRCAEGGDHMDTGNASVENGYLVLSGVTKNFGTFRALSDISFDIGEGEFICFLGPSGCGKTTLDRKSVV